MTNCPILALSGATRKRTEVPSAATVHWLLPEDEVSPPKSRGEVGAFERQSTLQFGVAPGKR